MKKFLGLLTIFFLFFAFHLSAQPDPGGDPEEVPIDGGASLLAAGGIAYGVKKIVDYRKKKNMR